MGELSSLLNKDGLEIEQSPVSAEHLGQMIMRLKDGTINGKAAKTVFAAMAEGEGSPDEIIKAKDLVQNTDSGAVEKLLDDVLAANAEQVGTVPRQRRSQARQDVRLLRRPGHESGQGQGQPGASERTAEEEARSLSTHFNDAGLARRFFVRRFDAATHGPRRLPGPAGRM